MLCENILPLFCSNVSVCTICSFVRIRDDKSPEDASTADYVVQLYQKQTRKASSVAASGSKGGTAATASQPRPAKRAAAAAEEQDDGGSDGHESDSEDGKLTGIAGPI